MKINRGANPGFLVLWLLVAAFALFGCGKQETPPESTPPPAQPPPSAKGNPHCVESGSYKEKCKITTDDIDAETGSSHDCGAQFDDDTAIHITKGDVAKGKFKKINVVKGPKHTKNFEVTIDACDGSPSNPFPHADNPKKDNWQSGDLDAAVPAGSRYRLLLSDQKMKGKKPADPHIVIDGK